MASKAALKADLEKKRQEREKQRQKDAEESAKEGQRTQSALRIQCFVRGVIARCRWSANEWKSLHKQVNDLSTLANIMRQKGQQFVAPSKVLLALLRRSYWQALRHSGARPPEELAEVLCTLAVFAVDGLRLPHADTQRSLCSVLQDNGPLHVPDTGWTLLRFSEGLFEIATGSCGGSKSRISATSAATASLRLSEFLDAGSWAAGSALRDLPGARELAARLLTSSAEPSRLHAWRAAATAAVALWPGAGAPVPERLSGLVGVAAAWLWLTFYEARSFAAYACQILEAALGVPRLAAPFAARFQQLQDNAKASAESQHNAWSLALSALARHFENRGGAPSQGSEPRRGSAKALEREYAMAYTAGNLWELHVILQKSPIEGLPLGPLLAIQAQLTELAVEVSMLPGAPATHDEPIALQELRRQLQQLSDPAMITKLFSSVLRFRYAPKLAAIAPLRLRAYQHHCLAVADHALCPTTLESLSHLYSALLIKARAAAKAGFGHHIFQSLANTIAYMDGGDVPKALWRHIQSVHNWSDVSRLGDQQPLSHTCLRLLHLHAILLSQSLSIMTYDELRGPDGPLCAHDIAGYVARATSLASWLAWYGGGSASSTGSSPMGSQLKEDLLECLGRVLGQLYALIGRKTPLGAPPRSLVLPPEAWHAGEVILADFSAVVKEITEGLERVQATQVQLPTGADRLLRHLPQAIPFKQRVTLLRARVQLAREAGLARPQVKLAVRRTHLFEDGLTTLMHKDADWRARFQVVFVSAVTGRPEQGQDAGGLFKEFWEKLAETAFNPEYGLFRTTEERLLFPNPEAGTFHEQEDMLFEFLGLVIGKAIFEGIVVEPSFAPFFLAKLLGKHNSYYDLQSLDPALFANLQQLKEYTGDVADLCCSFVATTSDGREVPLLPGGAGKDVPVTAENRVRYVYLLSDYKLNAELKTASSAFLAGFRRLIDERWLRMFSEDELQQVISGSHGSVFDVDDLQRHTQVSNCSGPRDRLVQDFFTALKAMSPEHRVKLLRFVTSCSRAPLLGFSHLQPPFTVHKVHVRSDSEKLPTASTCFNTLKLPTYSSWKIMKQKLEYVILQDAGFELD